MPKFSALDISKFGVTLAVCLLVGCATQTQQIKMNESKEQFKNGDLQNTTAAIQSAFKDKNTLYYMELGEVQRLQGPTQIPNSTQNLLAADQLVSRWEVTTSDKLRRSFSGASGYVLSEGFSSEYDPKPYEVSLLSQTIALNHISQGRWNDAMVEAKKMAQREKVIEELIQSRVAAVSKVEQEQQNNPNTQGASSRIESISGYPINLLDDEETRSLKNSYQNPAAYYLSGFIHESQGEASLAAPGYRLAIELRPQVNFFKTSIAKLDSNIANQGRKTFADTLIIIDTGYMPKIIPYQISQSFNLGGNPKLVTLTFPVIEKSTERFRPTMVQLGDKVANPELVANIDAMARKNLRDEMPAYVLRASSRALVSLAAQYAADRAAQQAANKRSQSNQNNQNNGSAALIGAIAGMITGYSLQAINVTDVRHWSTLPAQTYMARMGLPIGPTVLKYTLPSGVTASQTVNLVGGYNVVYIRMFRNRATVLTSNDPTGLPPKDPVVGTPIVASPAAISPASPQPALVEPKPSEGAFAGFKKLWGGFQDPLPEESASAVVTTTPVAQTSPVLPAPISTPNPTPNNIPASGNMEGVRPYEPPNLLNSFQQLFN
ncbi:hypothetical protein VC159_07425 [Polynucleobacter sp. JS-JIR-II-c23]|uniref:COG3014 family protein n=1 Tax=Polynucleobacter sp. JS-JIR-II-c23 TaxID=1758393 RepID=UPI002B23C164|nr:hypothetical protein [Polynucleobacter sp. JS-JIR-II-c23]MEA9604276.1 hypothetical protein [Polynucleobacter sp. JS-JIR-II-c23]